MPGTAAAWHSLARCMSVCQASACFSNQSFLWDATLVVAFTRMRATALLSLLARTFVQHLALLIPSCLLFFFFLCTDSRKKDPHGRHCILGVHSANCFFCGQRGGDQVLRVVLCIWLRAFGTGERQAHFIVNPSAHLLHVECRVVITQRFFVLRVVASWSGRPHLPGNECLSLCRAVGVAAWRVGMCSCVW